MKTFYKNPLFLGLTHIGQVFSVAWSEKFGYSSVFDFNHKLLENFKKSKLTDEEPNLKKLYHKNKKKIFICSTPDEIKNFNNIFLTIDTPLLKNAQPDFKYIKKYIQQSLNYIAKNSNIIITSQVYCGFCDEIKKTILKSRKDINIIYMAETLVMGNALKRFLSPERLIFGASKNFPLKKELKKFDCPIFVLNYRQAEMIKMAINLFLLTSVSYANLLDLYCREYGFKFSTINEPIRLDNRVGKSSYISPSLGISGGHLERDLFSLIKTTKNSIVRNTFNNFKYLSKKRIELLTNLFNKLRKKKKFSKVIWMGPSYKKDSFSILNSPYYHFRNYLIKKKIKLYTYDSLFDLEKHKIKNIIKKIEIKNFTKSLIIINYLNQKDKRYLQKMIKDKTIKIIDIGINKNIIINSDNITYLLN